jgi:hypothetical protein
MPNFKTLADNPTMMMARKMPFRRDATQDRANALNMRNYKPRRPDVTLDDAVTPEMRNYKPRRPDVTLDDVVTPEIRAIRAKMIQGAKQDDMMESAGSAYDRAMPAPDGPGGGGMKKGGKVGSASSRADGCAVKGKTKGRMI